jgi:hypothetical protein
MSLDHLLSSIDAEISRLQRARTLLAGNGTGTRNTSSRLTASHVPKTARRKRVLSAEGRKRIAEAQRKRWAAQKKAAGSTK